MATYYLIWDKDITHFDRHVTKNYFDGIIKKM